MTTKSHRCTEACRWFRLLAWTWCTTLAEELVENPEMVERAEQCDITTLDSLLGFHRTPDARTIPLINYSTGLNKDYAKGVDLARPIIVVDLGDSFWVIDGWHRIWRARMENKTHLPAVVLTAEAARLAHVAGAPMPEVKRKLVFAEVEPIGPTLYGDVHEGQVGDAWGRRFVAPVDSGKWAVIDVAFYADAWNEDTFENAGTPLRITCEGQRWMCTNPDKPAETALDEYGAQYYTVTETGELTSERAKALCEAFNLDPHAQDLSFKGLTLQF